jgi:HAD superfamily hydrolase (TIGR01509 family)
VYEAAGVELTEQVWTSAVGSVNAFLPKAFLENATGRVFDWESIDRERRRKLLVHQHAQPVLPGVADLMLRGREAGFRIGVASNSTRDWVEHGLERLGLLPLIEVIRTVETVPRPKPFPDVYLAVLGNLQAEAGQSFAFEDSEPGVRAAKAAGLRVVAVPSALTRYQDLSLADCTVASLEGFDWQMNGIIEVVPSGRMDNPRGGTAGA